MKKKTLCAIAGGGLSLALAAVALGGFLGNQAKGVRASDTTESITTFSATSGSIGTGGVLTYASYKGDGTAAPAINSNVLRLYQAGSGKTTGGYVIITAKAGYKITAFSTISTMATTLDYSADGSTTWSGTGTAVTANGTYSKSGLSTSAVGIVCKGTTSSARYYCSSLSATYAVDANPSISPDALANHINVGDTGTFTATTANVTSPVVTWSSATTSVLTVNETTGAYSAVAYGTSLVTASMTVSGTAYTGSMTVVVDGTATPTQILALGLASGETTSYKLTTSGTITAVATNSVTISDGTGSLMIYGTYSPNNAASKGWGVGGVISFKGNVQYYNGTTYEIVSPSLVSYTGNATALANFIMMASTANQCATQFAIAKAQFLAMSPAEQALFQTAQTGEATVITNARARYEAWAVNQGDAAPYSSGAAVVDGLANSTGMIAIAIVSVLGLLTLAGVVILKKKHN
jgi:hypothetical protein